MTIVRIRRTVFVLLATVMAGLLGLAATPAAAEPWPVQRFTLNGMWADVTMPPTVPGDSLFILVELVPHDSGVPLRDRRVTVDLTPLGHPRTVDLYDVSGDGSPALELFTALPPSLPAGSVVLRFTAAADLGEAARSIFPCTSCGRLTLMRTRCRTSGKHSSVCPPRLRPEPTAPTAIPTGTAAPIATNMGIARIPADL